jgi:hypothetical protein
MSWLCCCDFIDLALIFRKLPAAQPLNRQRNSHCCRRANDLFEFTSIILFEGTCHIRPCLEPKSDREMNNRRAPGRHSLAQCNIRS